MAVSKAQDPSYTVFIRLPFTRGDFVDPPPVDWDAVKDKQLWKILSKASKNSDIDWNALAERFDVSLPFLLQQAAWLYERQLSQVRAQMRKVGASKSAQSPVPSDSTGGEAMRRTGSGGGGSSAYTHTSKLTPAGPRAPSSLSTRKDSPIPKTEASVPNTPSRSQAPPLSRTSSASTATAIQSRNLLQTSPRPVKAQLHRLSMSPTARTPAIPKSKNVSSSEEAESSSSDSSSESESAQSRLIRRQPRFPSNKLGRSEDADDDDEGPAFLPFATAAETPSSHDPSATLRGDPRNIARRTASKKSTEVIQQSQTSDSSNSSTAPARLPPRREISQPQRPTGPLSPRRTAELAGRGSMGRGKGSGRDGSDGTPSMGSSFSDLDDASVTQSALEEALASNMQQGGVASRMSTISQALRSRYL